MKDSRVIMIDEQLNHYLLGILPPNDEWVNKLERQARDHHVPIMDRLSMHFLMQLIRISQPKQILEIGTAIGYSALRMIEANPNVSIITIERDQHRYKEAIKNIQNLQKEDNIDVMFGDAKDVLIELNKNNTKFDFIFIDAAKGQYRHFFELSEPLLNENSMIVSDNVLFRGYVAGLSEPHPRHKRMVEKIKEYNEWLARRPDFTTTFVPIGDGIAISVKQTDQT